MPNSFQFKRRVEFSETDAAGIVHFSSLMQYAEQAEHALLRSLGTSVLVPISIDGIVTKTISWPRVKIEAEFHGSAKFEQEIDISIQVKRLGTKSITYAFRMSHQAQPICSGSSTSVCCEITLAGQITSIEVPLRLKQQLQSYVI